MLAQLVGSIHAFIPVSVITGMLVGLWMPVHGRRALRPIVGNLAAGIIAGLIIYLVALQQETVTTARACLFAAAGLAALGNGGILLRRLSTNSEPCFETAPEEGASSARTEKCSIESSQAPFALRSRPLLAASQRSGSREDQQSLLPVRRSRLGARLGWGATLLLVATFAAVSTFSFVAHLTEQTLSSISVLNTELILNFGGIVAGCALMASLIPVTAHLSAKSGGRTVLGFVLLASGLLIVQSGAEVLLALMRLELVEPTRVRLSFIAKTTKYSALFPYVQALIVIALSGAFLARRTVITSAELAAMQAAERRKARRGLAVELRWFAFAVMSVVLSVAVILYYDVYCSRPPKISPAIRLTLDASGLIKIKIDELKDGKLHRYAHVTDDGHVVRFFLINRSRGEGTIGVVYDACMLCGDTGYLQQDNEIICIACNVRIFRPSIGRAGGCNPIPLEHKVEGGEVVISREQLDKGARYFSEIVSIAVNDPVTGARLDNLKAPYRFEYKGRTYFFESQESGEKFKESPETYLGEQQPREDRVLGCLSPNQAKSGRTCLS